MSAANPLCCGSDAGRRELSRHAVGLYGFDYVELGPQPGVLYVYFLGRAPSELTARALRITGGRRIRELRIVYMEIERSEDLERDDRMRLVLDRVGDPSQYQLCVFALDAEDKRCEHAPADFDPRYRSVAFSFDPDCPRDLDCMPVRICPATVREQPALDYLAKDYASFRQLLLERLALIMPDWRERHVPDLGITLLELLAYAGDQLSYFQDAVATEAYLETARRRVSVRRHLRLVDYRMHEGCNARAFVALDVSQPLTLPLRDIRFLTRSELLVSSVLAVADLPSVEPAPYLVFEPLAAGVAPTAALSVERNTIQIYTWHGSECCLARGATRATLLDPARNGHQLALEAGTLLIFEEVKGPKTGNPADADPSHRHAVRLTAAHKHSDPVPDPQQPTLLWDVEWSAEDALPFPLCLTTQAAPPLCATVTNVSVVRGNVILVDHGRTVHDDLCPVPTQPTPAECPDDCRAAEVEVRAGRYRPTLPRAELTFAVPLSAANGRGPCPETLQPSAAALLHSDPQAALPQIALESTGTRIMHWQPQLDLLDSGPRDPHFVVEVDDDRVAQLRFGEGTCGASPEAGAVVQARYRIGNGTVGNVGAEAIAHIAFTDAVPSGARIAVRNPLPASGGAGYESVARAKQRGPQQFRSRLERAITPDDYAAIALRDFPSQLQRAAGSAHWNGSGLEIWVALDPRGSAQPTPELLCQVERHLQRYRRIGHGLAVVPAQQVALDLELEVCVHPSYLRAHVEAALLERFGHQRQADGSHGFFHPDNLSFGESVYASRIVASAQQIAGVMSSRVSKLERLYEGPNGELQLGELAIGPLEIARLDNDPAAPELGRLRLRMGGGR